LIHRTTARFWLLYRELPVGIQAQADRAFALLRENPRHPSLRFKKIGEFWSARVGAAHRVLAVEDGGDVIWVWIGPHDEYDRLIRSNAKHAGGNP
jgi:hypothetical protein